MTLHGVSILSHDHVSAFATISKLRYTILNKSYLKLTATSGDPTGRYLSDGTVDVTVPDISVCDYHSILARATLSFKHSS